MSEPFQTFGIRMDPSMKAAAEADAERLKMKPAEWGRMAVARTLRAELTLTDVDEHRDPPTKKELKARATQAATPPAPLERREVDPIPKPGRRR